MTPQVIHDSFRLFATGLYSIIVAGVVVVLGTLLWSDISSVGRPEGCRRGEKLSRFGG